MSCINDSLPSSVATMLKLDERTANTRHAKHFSIPRSFTNYRAFALPFSAPRIWNSVVVSKYNCLEDVPRNKGTLKSQIRKHFIDKYSDIN